MDLYVRGIFESITEKYTHIKSSIAKKMESSFPPALGLNLLHPDEGTDQQYFSIPLPSSVGKGTF